MLFQNRTDAGQRLARRLRLYVSRPDIIVLALPRGGVPVAAEIAKTLQAPLDVLVVRKLGVPGSAEMAMGAIATGDLRYLNQTIVQQLGITPDAIAAVIQQEEEELHRREKTYRNGRPPLNVKDHTVILVDDGLATGATIRVALAAIKQQNPREITVAVPVAAPEVYQTIEAEVDNIVCAETPRPFYAVGLWYKEFPQTSDEEVRSLLRQAMSRTLEAAGRDR